MSCTHEALSPYTRDSSGGPTPTTTRQKQFAQRLRGVLSRLNAKIREWVDERDFFNLRNEALVEDPPDEDAFPTRKARVSGFLGWLRTQLDNQFLGVVGEDRNQFIRAAYATGIREAEKKLSDLDIAFTRSEGVEDVLSRPIHKTALRTLYTRVYENLESVRDDVAQAVRDELLDGFQEGRNPRDIARSLTDRVDSIGKHRATIIARSEVLNAYSEASLNTYEEVNRDADTEIGVQHTEWITANDDRVCAICEVLDGATFTLSEMRNGRFEVGGTTYRLQPPAHAQGRCDVVPVVGIDASNLGPLADRVPNADEITT